MTASHRVRKARHCRRAFLIIERWTWFWDYRRSKPHRLLQKRRSDRHQEVVKWRQRFQTSNLLLPADHSLAQLISEFEGFTDIDATNNLGTTDTGAQEPAGWRGFDKYRRTAVT
jgi:hypothetical protein